MNIVDQIAAAKRELAMRQRVYPNLVKSGRMTQAKADHEIAAMAAIVRTLETRPAGRIGADRGPEVKA